MNKGRELLHRAKDGEIWNPKYKSEPYAQSGIELMKLAKDTIEDFFKIPIGITDDLVLDLADGLEMLLHDYSTFVASCGNLWNLCRAFNAYQFSSCKINSNNFFLIFFTGSKQSYLPTLPMVTRCHTDSKFIKLWKKASPYSIGVVEVHHVGLSEGHHPRPSTSCGTQQLYIRLNTLHYLLSQLHSLDKTLALSPRIAIARSRFANNHKRHGCAASYFEYAQNSLQTACQHVSEVAAHRLIFLDSSSVFYKCLYVGDVTNSRIRLALRILKQNFTLLTAIVNERAQASVMREVMKAAFDAYFMVLLAGGANRIFYKTDYPMIEEDFDSLKKTFCTCAEGLIN